MTKWVNDFCDCIIEYDSNFNVTSSKKCDMHNIVDDKTIFNELQNDCIAINGAYQNQDASNFKLTVKSFLSKIIPQPSLK